MKSSLLLLLSLAVFDPLSAQSELTNDSEFNESNSLYTLTEEEAIAYIDALSEDSSYFEYGMKGSWIQSIEISPIFGHISNPLYSSYNPRETNVRGHRLEGFLTNIPEPQEDKWLIFYELEKLNYVEQLEDVDDQKHGSFFISRADAINQNWAEATEIFYYYSESALDLALEDQLEIESRNSEIILGYIAQKFEYALSPRKSIEGQLGIKNIQLLNTSGDFNEYSLELKYLMKSEDRQLEINLFNHQKDYLFENKRAISGIGFSAKASFDFNEWLRNSTSIKLCEWHGNSDGYDNKTAYNITNRTHLALKDWDLILNLFYSKKDYSERYLLNNDLDDNAFDEPYHFDTYGINLTAEKTLNDSFDFIIQYEYEENRSQSNDEDYDIEKLLLSLRYTFL